ncbi:MAG: TolC family protein [Gammaproteobacteria bacterium]
MQSRLSSSTLIGDVATAYFDLRSLDRQLDITRRTVKTREASLDLIRRRHRRGAVSGLDVSRAESELAAAQATLPELKRQSLATENRLRILLAENPGPVPRAGRPLAEQFPPQVPAGLPSSLLERRPDLRAAEYNLVSANALIGATKAALFPTISLTGLLGGESRALSDLFIGPARTWSLGLSLLQPILNADASRYQVEAARARTEQALQQYQQTVQQAFREVSDALNDTAQFNAVHAAQQEQVRALSRSSRLAQLRYASGYSSYLEVLDANRELFAAELALSQAQRNSLVSVVQLYRALGGGWMESETSHAVSEG